MVKNVVVVLLVVISVFVGVSQASITNGDFELVDGDGQFILDPWIPSSSELVINEGGHALFGENYFGDRISSLNQTFDSSGGVQKISFDYQMFSDLVIIGPPDSDTFNAYLNDVKIFSINNDNFPLELETFSTNVQLFAGQNIVKFELFSDDEKYVTRVKLDNVVVSDSVAIVPVPSAMLLGGLGVVSVVWLRKRGIL